MYIVSLLDFLTDLVFFLQVWIKVILLVQQIQMSLWFDVLLLENNQICNTSILPWNRLPLSRAFDLFVQNAINPLWMHLSFLLIWSLRYRFQEPWVPSLRKALMIFLLRHLHGWSRRGFQTPAAEFRRQDLESVNLVRLHQIKGGVLIRVHEVRQMHDVLRLVHF